MSKGAGCRQLQLADGHFQALKPMLGDQQHHAALQSLLSWALKVRGAASMALKCN